MQILYAGDEFMKRKYSICIFAAVLLAVSGLSVWFGTTGRGGSDKEQTKTQEEWQENTEENAISAIVDDVMMSNVIKNKKEGL